MKKWMLIVFTLVWCVASPPNVMGEGAPHSLEQKINQEIDRYLGEHRDRVVFRYENLQTGEFVSKGGRDAKHAASTIKLPLALLLIELEMSGEIDLTEELTYRPYHYYGGSGVIQHDKEGTSYTIKDLTQKMLVHSDNIAFIMLREHVGRQAFIQYMKGLGADFAYPNGQNLTSANDLTSYVKKLYQIKNESEFSKEVFGWLQHTAYEHGIPQGVEQPVAHKVGMIPMSNISNDTGIVLAEEPYALTILTTDYPYYQSKTIIKDITEIIHHIHQTYEPELYAEPINQKNRHPLL